MSTGVPAEASSCREWLQLSLPRLDPGVLRAGWDATLSTARELLRGDNVRVFDMRLMVVGASEVRFTVSRSCSGMKRLSLTLQAGKTSLVKALVSPTNSAEHIRLEDRSAALDISTQKLPLPGNNADASDTIQCRLWDFGGHEVFYLSHTMHFTGRCLYLLTWSPVKHVNDSGAFVELSMEDVTAPLKKWIRILAVHAPESSVVLVGTHSSCATAQPFVEIQDMVRRIVCVEAAVMVRHARREAKQLHFMLESTLAQLVWAVQAMLPLLRQHHAHLVPKLQEMTADSLIAYCKQLEQQQPLHASLRRHVSDMNTIVAKYERTVERLQLVYGIRDGLPPPREYKEDAVMKLEVLDACSVDSLSDAASILNFKDRLNALLRKKSIDDSSGEEVAAFPFIGELQPRWYNNVFSEIYRLLAAKVFAWGNSVASLADACDRLASVPSISRQTAAKLSGV